MDRIFEVIGFPDKIPRVTEDAPQRRLRVRKTYLDESSGILVKSDKERSTLLESMACAMDKITNSKSFSDIIASLVEFEYFQQKIPYEYTGALDTSGYNTLIQSIQDTDKARTGTVLQCSDLPYQKGSSLYIVDRVKKLFDELPLYRRCAINYLTAYLQTLTEKALRESIPNGHFGGASRIEDAIHIASTMKLDKFSVTKTTRTLLDTCTNVIVGVRSASSELIPLGQYLKTVRKFEIALLKDESVARTIGALAFSPDSLSTISSLKKIRRELRAWDGFDDIDGIIQVNALIFYPILINPQIIHSHQLLIFH